MGKLDELLKRKREKEAEIEERKRQVRDLGFKVTLRRSGVRNRADK
jgi:hypothetical protein